MSHSPTRKYPAHTSPQPVLRRALGQAALVYVKGGISFFPSPCCDLGRLRPWFLLPGMGSWVLEGSGLHCFAAVTPQAA